MLVRYRLLWVDGTTEIADCFVWPKRNRAAKAIKMFAIDFLSDVLGATRLKQCLPTHVAAFANFVAYIVNREIDISDHMSLLSVESMVKNGVFGHAAGAGPGEHLIPITLTYGEITETITWDICNPDNQPEDFAALLVSDLNLKPVLEYTVAISYEIRKQITTHCCRKLQTFTSYYENYVAQEIEVFD